MISHRRWNIVTKSFLSKCFLFFSTLLKLEQMMTALCRHTAWNKLKFVDIMLYTHTLITKNTFSSHTVRFELKCKLWLFCVFTRFIWVCEYLSHFLKLFIFINILSNKEIGYCDMVESKHILQKHTEIKLIFNRKSIKIWSWCSIYFFCCLSWKKPYK